VIKSGLFEQPLKTQKKVLPPQKGRKNRGTTLISTAGRINTRQAVLKGPITEATVLPYRACKTAIQEHAPERTSPA
jgi:hypothetical protein